MPLIVVKQLEFACLLGNEYQCRFPTLPSISTGKKQRLEMGNICVPMTSTYHSPKQQREAVQLSSTLELPPRTRQIVTGKVCRPYINLKDLIFEPDPAFEIGTNLICASALVNPISTEHFAEIPLEIVNINMHPLKLYKNTTLGKVSPCLIDAPIKDRQLKLRLETAATVTTASAEKHAIFGKS